MLLQRIWLANHISIGSSATGLSLPCGPCGLSSSSEKSGTHQRSRNFGGSQWYKEDLPSAQTVSALTRTAMGTVKFEDPAAANSLPTNTGTVAKCKVFPA